MNEYYDMQYRGRKDTSRAARYVRVCHENERVEVGWEL
jgi:hypothetical protein